MARKTESKATPINESEVTAKKTSTKKAAAKETTPAPKVEPKKAVKAKKAETPTPLVSEPVAAPKKGLFGRERSKPEPTPAPVEPTPVAEAPAAKTAPVKATLRPKGKKEKEEPVVEEKPKLKITLRPKKGAVPAPVEEDDEPQAPAGQESEETAGVEIDLKDSTGRLSILKWRKPGVRQATVERPQAELEPRKEKPGRKDRDKVKAKQDPEPLAKPEPKEELRQYEPIVIPEMAAQVLSHEGTPVLVKNGKIYPAIAFFGLVGSTKQPSPLVEQVQLASEHGIHLFSTTIDLEVNPAKVAATVVTAQKAIQEFSQVDSQAQVILRVCFTAPLDWETAYPDSKYKMASGHTAAPSICDEAYWSVANQVLSTFIEQLISTPEADHLMGLHLDRNAWYAADGEGYDTCRSASHGFQTWLRQRYRDDVTTLRASWYDGGVTFDSAEIPDYGPEANRGERFVRMGRKSRRWTDFHLFLSDITVERLVDLCYTAKKASGGNLLTGLSYGYTFEWSHPDSGHLSLGKLLRCPFLNYVAGPPSYRDRLAGGAAAFPMPVDSVALNGKLYISEEDFKTPIGGFAETDGSNPVIKTPQALESAHWRGVGSALAHRHGVEWMDSQGHGWLGSRGIWERASTVRETLLRRLAAPVVAPEVAMLIDERSLALLVDSHAFSALVQNVQESLLRSGLSVGFYLLSDLAHRENFPESKLYVFANAWDMRPEVRSAIKTRLHRDGKVLFWLYAAGLFEGGRESLERVREVTGIALRPQPFNSKPGTTILNTRDPLCQPLPQDKVREGGHLEPSYFAIPEEGTVLAEYTQTALASYVVNSFDDEHGKWTSVFLGEPIVTPGLFRALGALAGCHVWGHDDDVIHTTANFLTIHCGKSGQRTLNMPDKWVAYRMDTKEYAPVEMNQHKFIALEGSTHAFMVGTADVVSGIIDANLAAFETMAVSAAREENVMHWDTAQFDVPIMKLDEWVEETWTEEMADDLLVRPSMMEIDLEGAGEEGDSEDVPRSRGRRRKRRNGGRDRDGKADQGEKQAVGNTGFSVMFRKRE